MSFKRSAVATHVLALSGYLLVAIVYTWPLPAHLGDTFLGSTDGDVGEYAWNLWVFRHQIVAHHASPLYTSEILSLTAPASLTLQNYTPFADIIAFPLLPLIGLVRAFNIVTILSGVLAGYAMFLFARHRTQDAVAGWIGGLVFGFSAYMTARQSGHLSLALAAPLPVFCFLLYRVAQSPCVPLAALSGLVVGWAYLCDPYYAIYCLLILAFMVGYSTISVESRADARRRTWPLTLLDLTLFAAMGLIGAVVLTGGTRFNLMGVRIGIHELYTPVLIASVLSVMRGILLFRPRINPDGLRVPGPMPLALAGTTALCLMLAPVLVALASPASSPLGVHVPLYWRSSPPGVDLLAYVLPSPYHPLTPASVGSWLEHQPNGLIDNVSAVPWVALVVIGVASVRTRNLPHRGWILFTAAFAWLSLGPFIHVAGVNTYIPTPWALLRYMPIIGSARMPSRMAVVTSLGVAMLCAMAVQQLRHTTRRRDLMAAMIGVALVFEMLPWPTPLYSAEIPAIYRVIAADPRPVRVLNLPFGLRDGVSSRGDYSSDYQYHQTLHEKPLVGGYLSRLPRGEIERYLRIPLMTELLDLSEGHAIDAARARAAIARAPVVRDALNIGWVVVDTQRAGSTLVEFAKRAFNLEFVDRDGRWELYRAPLDD